jgi:uncharacterized protein Usg
MGIRAIPGPRQVRSAGRRPAGDATMSDRAFIAQLEGYGLTLAEIHYYRPDAPSLLQLFVWQQYDLAPGFPGLLDFLDHWRSEIDAALHSVRIAHQQLIRPTEWRAVDGIIRIH